MQVGKLKNEQNNTKKTKKWAKSQYNKLKSKINITRNTKESKTLNWKLKKD